MKIKTIDLTGEALDWAVGFARTLEVFDGRIVHARGLMVRAIGMRAIGIGLPPYSSDESESRSLVQQEGLAPEWSELWKQWTIPHPRNAALGILGPTKLVTAMRCFVTKKLGDYVNIPEQLLLPEVAVEPPEHEQNRRLPRPR